MCQLIYYTVNLALTGFLLREEEAKKCSGIINLSFGVLVDKTRGHFTGCSQCFLAPSQGAQTICSIRNLKDLYGDVTKFVSKAKYWG